MSLFWIVLCKYHDITHVIMIVLRSSAFLPTRWLIVCIGWFLIVSITDADAKNNSSWSRSLETRLLFHYRITTIYKKNRKREKLSCVWVKCLYDTYVTVCLVFVLRVLTNRPLPCIVVYRVRTAVEVPVLLVYLLKILPWHLQPRHWCMYVSYHEEERVVRTCQAKKFWLKISCSWLFGAGWGLQRCWYCSSMVRLVKNWRCGCGDDWQLRHHLF